MVPLGQTASRLLPRPLHESHDCGGFLLLGKGLEEGSQPLSAVDLVSRGNPRQRKPRKLEKENPLAH